MSTALVVESSLKTPIFATPNNYGVTHIAVGTLPTNVAWSEAVVVRKYTGYPQNINDGVQIHTIHNSNAIVKVDSVFNSSGYAVNGIGSITTLSDICSYTPGIEATDNTIVIPGTSIGTGVGTDAAFSYVSGLVPVNLTTATGFAVNDMVTVLVDELNGRVETQEPNEYGITARYHLYDVLGINTATTVNPKEETATEASQANPPAKAYYSLFIKYYPTYSETTSPTGAVWKKAGEVSSFIIKDTGTLDTLVNHLPAFYTRDSQTSAGNDLIDFLKVFAFQLDIYKAESANVFYSTNVSNADEQLLNLLLKEFGVSLADTPNLSQARTVAANIIKIYKESGSSIGLKNLIEAYTGYEANLTAGRNYMPDYNSSSFEENTGFWYPIYNSSTTVVPVITSIGPVDNSSIAAFSDSGSGYGRVDVTVENASCLTSSTTVTGTFGSSLKVGSMLSVTSGTGTFANGTMVTSILSSTTFRINKPPTVALSSASIRASRNMVSGMGKIAGVSGTTTAEFNLGYKQVRLTKVVGGTTPATILYTVTPASSIKVDEFVISSLVPYGTQVTSVVSTTGNVTLSNLTTISTSSAATVGLSTTAAESVGAAASRLPVIAGMPYSFGAYFNSGTSATSTTTVSLSFYDRAGNSISSTNASNKQVYGSLWSPNAVKAIAPTGAVYAEPKIKITGIASTAAWYVDASQFDTPLNITGYEVPAVNTIRITTDKIHNYQATVLDGTGVGTTTTNTILVTGTLKDSEDNPIITLSGEYNINSIPSLNQIEFTHSGLSATSAYKEVTGGYVVSNATYEDARKVNLDVLPNRINLVANPSFQNAENELNFWGNDTDVSNGAGINCGLAISYYPQSKFGDRAMSMVSSGTSPMAVKGYAGHEFDSGTSLFTGIPFKVEESITNVKDNFYTLSFYTKATTTARKCYAEIYWYEDSQATTQSTVEIVNIDLPENDPNYITTGKSVGTTVRNSPTEWTRHSVTGRAPEGAVTAKIELHVLSNTTSEEHILDGVLLEKSFTVSPYFDGSFDGQNYTSDRDSMWETGGTPHASRSHFYLNRISNTGLLKNIVTDGLYYA